MVYAYAESEVARQNLGFFVDKGLHGAADFVFVFNGETNASVLVPHHLANVEVVQRPNTCFDLGAIGEVLRDSDRWKNYKRFITMNASLRGPFVPVWSSDCWTDLYLNRITEHTKVCVPRCRKSLEMARQVIADRMVVAACWHDHELQTEAARAIDDTWDRPCWDGYPPRPGTCDHCLGRR